MVNIPMIDTERMLNTPLPKNYQSKFSPSGKDFIINRYIGREVWEGIKNKKTRYILMAEAMNKFMIDMIAKYGSWYKWQTDWCKRNGFKDCYDYKKWLANNLGFKTYSDYQENLVKKRGFKSRTDYEMKRIKKLGFKSWRDYLEECAKKAGFKNYSERRKFWFKRKLLLRRKENDTNPSRI